MKRSGGTWKCTGMVNKKDVKGKVIIDEKTNKPEKTRCKNSLPWSYMSPQNEQVIKNIMGFGKQ